jgi:hypothetical protein
MRSKVSATSGSTGALTLGCSMKLDAPTPRATFDRNFGERA